MHFSNGDTPGVPYTNNPKSPGLNSLANHGICPHNGKGYTIPILTDCLARGMNVGPDFALVVGTAGIGSNPNPLLMSFDLDMLDRHDAFIEHDASLSRAEASSGNNYSFNKTIWDTVLAYYNSSTDATIPPAAKARYNRILVEEARDPQFSFGPAQLLFQSAETALYLSVMGNPTTGVAPVKYVRSLFEQEKLPYELGWTPPTQQTTLFSLGNMLPQIFSATGETIPDGLILGQYSLRAALLGLDAATGAVQNSGVYALAQLTGALATLNSTSA